MSYSGSVYSRVVVEVLISGIDLSLWKIYEAGKPRGASCWGACTQHLAGFVVLHIDGLALSDAIDGFVRESTDVLSSPGAFGT